MGTFFETETLKIYLMTPPKNSWSDPHNLKNLIGVKKYTNGFWIFECNLQRGF